MTRRDYELLVEVFRKSRPDPTGMSDAAYTHAVWQWDRDIRFLCDALRAANPRFDGQRFKADAEKEIA